MKTLDVKLNAKGKYALPKGRVNAQKLDSFGEAELNAQDAQDEALAMQDAAKASVEASGSRSAHAG